jgi:dihydroxy-acid dehydratase
VSWSRRLRRPVHGQHHGDGDGDDRAVADEHRIGAAGGPAQASGGVPLRRSGDGRGARRRKARDIATREAFENAIASVAATGGSTNAVLHLLAMAREAEVDLKIDDFQTISSARRFRGSEAGGKVRGSDVDNAGGWPVVAKRMVDGGYAHKDAMTVTGRTFGEEAADAKETAGQEVIRALDNPIKKTGGLVILKGNLAPEGCVIKVAGTNRKEHRGPARVFNREEDAMAAVTGGKIKAGDVLVIRYEGPRGGPACARCWA